MTLLEDVNHPESEEDMVSNWEPAHSLVEDAVSGAEIGAALGLPALAVTCLPLCLQQGALYTAGVVDLGFWATSPLGIAVRHVIYGFHLFIYPPSYVAL